MPTTTTARPVGLRTAPAAPPAGEADLPAQDEGIALVSEYEAFAWNQQFTLVEPMPAPVFLNLLNAIIEREFDPDIRLRAIRMAAGVAEWTHEAFMRANFAYDAPEVCPESEAASRDPHEVDRHLILTSSLALEVGDPQFPRLAAGWLGIGSGVAHREAYYDVIEWRPAVLKILQKESPAEYLRAVVCGRVEDAERLRLQRAQGQQVLSIDHSEYKEQPLAECGVDAPAPFIESLLGLLRATPGKKTTRLASIIECVRDGRGKAELGRADYQYLYDNAEMLARMVARTGAKPVPAPKAARTSVSTQPWLYQRIEGVLNVAHRYSGRELEAYGAIVRSSLKNLEKSSADHAVSLPGK